MTILAVEKRENRVYVASDSRYSIGDIRLDNGTKIFKTDCVIRCPGKDVVKTSIGFAFDGNVTFFFNFKSRVEFIVRNILVQPCEDDYNEVVLDLIKNCYTDLCLECNEKIDIEGDVLVFFNSFNDGNALAYNVLYDVSTDNVTCSEICDGLTFYGSGKNVAERLIELNRYKNIVRFMKDVLAHKGNEETIGGNIQVGELSNNGFEILGYQDFEETSVDFGPHYYFGSSKVPKYDNFEPLDGSFLEIYTPKEQEDMANKNTSILTGVDHS